MISLGLLRLLLKKGTETHSVLRNERIQVVCTKKQGDWYKFFSIILLTIPTFKYFKKAPKRALLAAMKKDELGNDYMVQTLHEKCPYSE